MNEMGVAPARDPCLLCYGNITKKKLKEQHITVRTNAYMVAYDHKEGF